MRSDAIKAALLALFAGTATLGKPAPAGDVASRNHALPFLGHDVSSLLMMERDLNITYLNASGKPQALEHILAAGGAKAARLRLWVHPVEGVYDLEYNLQLARRIQDAGMGVYLDFHYSDTWADPQHQIKPESWVNQTFDQLVHTIGTYTHDVLLAFRSAGIRLDLVELGNEIRKGLLWPDGETPNYNNIARLLKSASKSARKVKSTHSWPAPLLGIHIDNGYSWATQQTFYDSVLKTKHLSLNDFDAQIVSFYPFYSQDSSLANLSYTTHKMAERYQKPIVVGETDWPVQCTNTTAYPFPPSVANIPFSPAGQIEWTRSILDVVQKIPHGLGKGLFYWEPGYMNNTGLGSECEDVLLFDADWSGWPTRVTAKARDSVNMFKGY